MARAYYGSGESSEISAYSPVTGKLYAMTCNEREPVRLHRRRPTRDRLPRPATDSHSARRRESAPARARRRPRRLAWRQRLLGDAGRVLERMAGEELPRAKRSNAASKPASCYSSNFSSLKPGYWVVFSGDFAIPAKRRCEPTSARSIGYSDSYPRLVSP